MLSTVAAFPGAIPVTAMPTGAIVSQPRPVSSITSVRSQPSLQPVQSKRTFFPAIITYPMLAAGAYSAFRFKTADREKGQVLVRMNQFEEDEKKKFMVDSQGMVWPWQNHRIVNTGPSSYQLNLHCETEDGRELFVRGNFEIGTTARPSSIQKYISFLEQLEKEEMTVDQAVHRLVESALNTVTLHMNLSEIESDKSHVKQLFSGAVQERLGDYAMVLFKHNFDDIRVLEKSK